MTVKSVRNFRNQSMVGLSNDGQLTSGPSGNVAVGRKMMMRMVMMMMMMMMMVQHHPHNGGVKKEEATPPSSSSSALANFQKGKGSSEPVVSR